MHSFLLDLLIMIQNYFVHKNNLPVNMPGRLFTPIQIVLEVILIIFIVKSALTLAKKQEMILPTFKILFLTLVIFEIVIIVWDTLSSGMPFDYKTNLSLYPCSIFMFVLPMIIWNDGIYRQIGCGYVCTLGIVGALINFLYPFSKLTDYACISFAATHTFFYHGSMLFVFIVIMASKMHSYVQDNSVRMACLSALPTMMMSIPANIINYSSIQADYMYFTNQLFLSQMVFGQLEAIITTMIMYMVYFFLPFLFYIPAKKLVSIIKKS